MAKKRKQATGRVASLRTPLSTSITRARTVHAENIDWGGVHIVTPNEPVQRLLPGAGTRARRVTMDLRSFVPSRASTVVSAWVEEQLEHAAREHAWLEHAVRGLRRPRSFDTVAHLLADAVFEEIGYQERGGAAWQLSEETLARGQGDCEDRAILLASALVAAGISPYNVRVALGRVRVTRSGARPTSHAHAWVMYRAEDGSWTALEPVPNRTSTEHAGLGFRYYPEYVFNGDHKWSLVAHPTARQQQRWNELDPTFHGEVHKSIVEHAAAEANVPDPLRTRLSRTFTTLFGAIVDNPDIRFRDYDPRDHFDSGLMEASWKVVQGRLKAFYGASLTDSKGTNNLCWALHGIADFYSHSSYAHFLKLEKGTLTPYDPATKTPALAFDYEQDPTFSKARLSHYDRWWQPSLFDRLSRWHGRAISGRYSLSGDSQSTIESITNTPASSLFPSSADRQFAGSLPHHDEIAVDMEPGSNKLYAKDEFALQYRWRYHLALRHMVAALQKHPSL
jgi:hypothetical protein